jgi:hypothetical protein
MTSTLWGGCRLDSPMRPCHRAIDQRGNVPLEVHRAAHSAAFKRSGQALGIGSNEVPQAENSGTAYRDAFRGNACHTRNA